MGNIPEEVLLYQIDQERKARLADLDLFKSLLENATDTFQQKLDGIASRVRTIDAKTGKPIDASALVGTIRTTQVGPGFAKAEEITTLEARITSLDTDIRATISLDRLTVVNLTEAIARQTTVITAKFNSNIASITETLSTITGDSGALASRVTTLEATVGTINATITTIESTYATISYADAKKSEAITASVTTANSYTDGQITSLSSVYATPSSVAASISTAISGALTTANSYTDGRISSLSSVYATPASVSASISTAISGALTTANTYTDGRISSLSSVYATPSSVSSSITTAVSAALTTANGYTDARISSVTTAYTTADAALAYDISILSASSGVHTFVSATPPTATGVGDIWFDTSDSAKTKRWDGSSWVLTADTRIAAVVTQSSANATAVGYYAGKYALQVIAGNVVTGMEITSATAPNGGTTSTIIFQAGVVKFQSGASNIDPLLAGGAAADVNANTTTISGGKITANTITAAHILAGNITATHIASNTIITTSANIGTAVIASANIASLDVAKLNAGTITVALELTAAKFTAGIISTGAARFNPADDTRQMPFVGKAMADLIAENGGPIDPTNTSTSGTYFSSTNLVFIGWSSGSTGVNQKRFGQADTFFEVNLDGSCNIPTGRMGYQVEYRVNSGAWNRCSAHHVAKDSQFENIVLSNGVLITGLAGTDTVEFAANIDHSAGASGPGIGELTLSVTVFNG